MRDIRPVDNNGSIQLRFTIQGHRYIFNPLPGGRYQDRRDLALVQAIATRIKNDVLAGVFDATLEKYRHRPGEVGPEPVKPPLQELLVVWDRWVETLSLPPETQADHYEMVRRMLVKHNPYWHDTSWLQQADLAPSTYNKRLSYLKKCLNWAADQGLIPSNPFTILRSRPVVRSPIQPLSVEEVQRILIGFQQRFPHYTPFVSFLLLTGVRTSEAIGLCWQHIDLQRDRVLICESLPKDRTGNGYSRKRKSTKTGSYRYLDLTPGMRALLEGQRRPGQSPDDLVFTSAQGCVIDSGNFREDWKTVLMTVGVPYRKPYISRHTLLSHALEAGIPLTGVAYLAGHADTRMVMQHYGHLVNRPQLPNVFDPLLPLPEEPLPHE